MECGAKTTSFSQLSYDLPYSGVQKVKNCFFAEEKYHNYFCSMYCEIYNPAQASNFLDGNLEQLQKFVKFITDNRKTGFPNPKGNIMMNVCEWEETYLNNNYKEFGRNLNNNEMFFTVSASHGVDQMTLLVQQQEGGFNPLKVMRDSMYPIFINSGHQIYQVTIAFVCLMVLQFK